MNQPIVRRCLPVFLVFILFASPASHSATSLWVAESGGAIKIASETGDILFEIPDAGGIDAIAVDNDSGRVWTYGRHKHQQRLRAYDAEGDLQVDVQAQIHHDTKPLDMLADADGVWLAAHRDVYRFDSQGQLQKHIRFRHPVSGMTLDTERSHLWVAVVSGHVFILDRNGNDVDHFWTYFPLIAQLDFDGSLDSVWLIAGPYLLRLNAETRDVEFVSRFGAGFKLWRHLSADGQGGVWGADPATLSHVNTAGEIEFTFKPFQGYHGKKTLQDLVADREDGSVWLANRTVLKQYSLVGAQQKELTPDLGDGVIRSISRLALAASTRPPELSIVFPTANSFINTNTPTLVLQYGSEGTVDTGSIQITHDNNTLSANCSATQTEASCVLNAALPEGDITLEVAVADTDGNISEPAQVAFTVDTVAPVVTVTNPADGLITNQPQLTVNGNVSETAATLTLVHGDSISLQADSNNVFSHSIALSEGGNAITIIAVDFAGNTGSASLNVTLDTVVPVIPDLGLISISRPGEDGTVLISGRAGSVEPNSKVTITNTRTGESNSVMADADGAFSASLAGQTGDDIRITVGDTAGNVSVPAQAPVTSLPPDPALIAPPLNPAQITPLLDATAFLYTGNHPIQTGVQPGTIEARRVAVIKGRVLDRQNNPLPGVTVSVKDHPGFGQTLSRADGRFDLAVNGGGVLTLDYQKESYLPVQRKVNAPWQDYIVADDIVMIQLDPQVTTIDLSQPAMQVARGTPQTDSDGTRQATLLFPAGTAAGMTLPDGTVQNLTTLNVRATEYTVGENGPNAMPGELPPTSGYTYAVELSVDEALAANATHVQFNQPVPFYVDNFLDFPTGEAVPVGYYGTDQAAWIPYDDGRIVEILSIDNGSAVLDVTGDGEPATQAQLDELGITAVELRQLATLYEPGKSLWRVGLDHFSAWDCNWPFGPPDDATGPPAGEVVLSDGNLLKDSKHENECPGCAISPQAQTVGEEIPVTGTPFTLHYRSDRVPGRKRNRVTIPVRGASTPLSLRRIRVLIDVAGQRHEATLSPQQTDTTYTFEWDGLDGFGREVYGSATATIGVGYFYPCMALSAGNGGSGGGRSFGRTSLNLEAIGTRDDCRGFLFPRRAQAVLESPLTPPVVVAGNWSLDVHHYRDANRARLMRGDGGHRTAGGAIGTVAGNGVRGAAGDGGLAVDTKLGLPSGVAIDPAGNIYLGEQDSGRILRISPDGIIATFAGGHCCRDEDDFPAARVSLGFFRAVATDSSGNVYIAEGNRIRKVDRNGIIHTVAGRQGSGGFSGDGGPAIAARLNAPSGLATDAAGNLYIADTGNYRVRKVSPDGIITTAAGNGEPGFAGDGGPASAAKLHTPRGLAVDTAGNLYIADSGNNRIRKVSPDGVITTVAGNGEPGLSGDDGPAAQSRINQPHGLAVDTMGNLYIADTNNSRIRRVNPEGLITTVAGSGPAAGGYAGDGGPATRAQFDSPRDVSVDALGNLYVADSWNHRIRQVRNEDAVVGITTVVSEDGARQFEFDAGGRHLRTVNTLTGAVEYAFGRDSEGRLIRITDADGDVTIIERETDGRATAIVAPDGQRTALTVDHNGHLTAVTDPAGGTYRMQYTPGGLLTEFRDRKNLADTFDYDALGRLTANVNAGLGGWTLERSELNRGYQTDMTTAEGRALTFTVEPRVNGDLKLVNTHADGGVQTRVLKPSGQQITTLPDGTQITLQESPDPRFGMDAPIPQNFSVRAPSGLTSTMTTTRAASLADPADPLSLQSLIETTTVNGNAYRSEYDAATKTFTYTSPEGRTGAQTINDRARPVRTQITGLAPVDFGYDARGRLERIFTDDGVEPRLTVLDYYDSGPQQGFLESITDAANRTVRFEYDPVGRVTRQILPDSREINYGYDANGNVTSIQPPGRPAHVFNYNAFNLEDEYIPPTVEGVSTPHTRYDYNLDKELTRITRPDGQEVNFAYNNKAQLESMTIPRGTYTYGYHPTTGQLESVTAPDDGTLTYNYDGFLLKGQTWGGEVSGSVTQSYNNNFLVSQRCVNASNCISFGYDNDSLLTSAGSLSIIRDPQRAGLVTDTALSNVVTSNGYNLFGELESFEAKYANTQYFNTVFTRDSLGRIKQKTEVIDGETVTEIYGYDLAGRLETVTRNGTVTTYAYDSNGNRLSKTAGSEVESGTYDDQDRLLNYAGCDYEYTDNGELQAKTCGSDVTTYDYDVLGNLLGVTLPDGTEIEYVIDGQNRRIGKKVNGELVQGFLYADQLNPIAELNADGSIRSRFVYGTKINVPDYMVRDGVTYRIVSDHLGSPRLVINTADGSVAQRLDYDEFGNITLNTNPGFQPFGFAGGLYDSQTQLVRFGARDYSAEVGRWLSKDPIGFRGGDANLYGYVINNPINLVDPNGLLVGGAIYRAMRGFTGQTSQEAAIAGRVVDAALGAASEAAAVSGLTSSLPPGVANAIDSAQAVLGAQTIGFGAALTQATAMGAGMTGAFFGIPIAGLGGWEIGSAINRLYARANCGRNLGTDILDATLGPIFFPEFF